MRLLLDTCTFLWVVSGSKELSHTARAAFVDPANEVFLSSASAWEIVIKHRLGKLPLPAAPDDFVRANREAHAIAALAIDEESVFQLSRLPDLHRDPFDRMIVCQAIAHGLAVLTPDDAIRGYPVRSIW